MTRHTQSDPYGFNLMEYLTVIAIIGIFAAILIFMVGRVIDSGSSLVCTSTALLRA